MQKLSFFVFTLLLWLSACRNQELDMTVLEKSLFETATFTEIVAEDAWNVTVVQDDHRTGVELEYSAFLDDYLQVVSNGNQLVIRFTQRLNLPSNTVKNATVYVATLENLELKEASTMTLQGTFAGPRFTIRLQEAATLRGGRFLGDIDLNADDASTIVDFTAEGATCTLGLDASVFKGSLTATDQLAITAEAASRVTTYGGMSPRADVVSGAASFINIVQTPVTAMNLQVREASEASVNVTNRLDGLAHDASKVFYQGNPIINMDIDNSSFIYPL